MRPDWTATVGGVRVLRPPTPEVGYCAYVLAAGGEMVAIDVPRDATLAALPDAPPVAVLEGR